MAEVTVEGIHNRSKQAVQLSKADGSELQIEAGETIRGPFVIKYDEAEEGPILSPNEIWIIGDPPEYHWATVHVWTPHRDG